MLKLTDLPETAQKAIRTNFATRNSRVFVNEDRHSRIRATRRNQIREWIAVLRVVRNPAMTECVAKRLKDSGPLMAHDLRNRVILAGLEHRLAGIQGQQ
jgi:hypothetical protein